MTVESTSRVELPPLRREVFNKLQRDRGGNESWSGYLSRLHGRVTPVGSNAHEKYRCVRCDSVCAEEYPSLNPDEYVTMQVNQGRHAYAICADCFEKVKHRDLYSDHE